MRLLLSDLCMMSFTGDLTQGAASTGPVLSHGSDAAAGFICAIEADSSGRAEFLNVALNPNVQVWACVAVLGLPRLCFPFAHRFGTSLVGHSLSTSTRRTAQMALTSLQ